MINIYGIKTCNSVRKAIKFCKENDLEHSFIDFRANPLDNEKVKYFASKVDINILFNNKGTKYRDLK
ncbi:MAG: arsenate reductase family protein, partial [Campylobacterota bacterium]|nr:arsenate reductase family protein [Campylobacterota bacterium]